MIIYFIEKITYKLADAIMVSSISDREYIIKKYKIQWIIFYNDSYFSRFLLGRDDWKLIYSDKMANIFVKDISKYEYLIKKYKEVKPLIRDESDYK